MISISDIDILIIHILQFEKERLSDFMQIVQGGLHSVLSEFKICAPISSLLLPKCALFPLTSVPPTKGPSTVTSPI